MAAEVLSQGVPWAELLGRRKSDIPYAAAAWAVLEALVGRHGQPWVQGNIELAQTSPVRPAVVEAHLETLRGAREAAVLIFRLLEGQDVPPEVASGSERLRLKGTQLAAYRAKIDARQDGEPFMVRSIGLPPSLPWVTSNGPHRDDIRYARYWFSAAQLVLNEGERRYGGLNESQKAVCANRCIEVVRAYRDEFGADLPPPKRASSLV